MSSKSAEGYVKPGTQRLQCKDPCIITWYNQILLETLEPHNALQQIQHLNNNLNKPSDLRRSIKKELNALDHVLTEAKRGAENHCRKFKNGQVQWFPQVTTAINRILFWKSILKRETGSKVGLSILCTQAWKAKIDTIPYLGDYQIKTLQEIILKAHKQFNHLKLDENRQDMWMAQLISAQAMAWNKKKKVLWQQMQRTEKICKTANAVRKALNKPVIR